jgi:hypothetical protein
MEESFGSLGAFGRVVGGGFANGLRFRSGIRITTLLALLTVVLSMTGTGVAVSAESCSNKAIRKVQNTDLSDCRAYELVSPAQKNGGDVMGEAARTRAAPDGSAAAFASLVGFGDVRGSGIATEYMSVRSGKEGTSGWATHAITPAQAPLSYLADFRGLDPLYENEFSADFSRGVFRAWSPLSDAPNVKDVENLYVRSDLRTPGAGTYTLASDADSALSPFGVLAKPFFAGASADFGRVLFESANALTGDATDGNPNLYVASDGSLRLAGILPDGMAAASSIAGQGASNTKYTPHTISSDGSLVFFTDPTSGSTGSDGALYERNLATSSTVQINASEKALPDAAQPATFWDASWDGKRAFFTTAEQLTEDDTNDVPDLYAYDTAAFGGGKHLSRLSLSTSADSFGGVQGVIGTSNDGSYVYFVASGQLVAGKPALESASGIYVWHDGTMAYVGELSDVGDDLIADTNSTHWSLFAVQARVTPDGRHLLFVAHDGFGLTGYDQGVCTGGGNGKCGEFYVYSDDSHQLACASCNPTGASATATATDMVHAGTGGAVTTTHLSHAISDDGRRVFFSTTEALVPGDANRKSDVYEYDVPSGTVHLISSGKDQSDSYFMDASATGGDVFFLTRQRLVGWDTDSNYDLYDARVGGGVPDPPPSSSGCSGAACQGPEGNQPSFDTPASLSVTGLGNPPTPVVKKVVVKSLTRAQKLARALRKCKTKRKRVQRKKCESFAKKSFARTK